MRPPVEIEDVVLEILTAGLLRSRAAAWAGEVQHAALEVDHIHNLPALLRDFSHEALAFYWGVERPSFETQAALAHISTDEFERLWQKLKHFVMPISEPALPK